LQDLADQKLSVFELGFDDSQLKVAVMFLEVISFHSLLAVVALNIDLVAFSLEMVDQPIVAE
jgi:hypothetical protein